MGFVAHYARLLDVDGLLVEVLQGETISPQGDVLEQDPIVILCEGAGGGRELTANQAMQLADARSSAPQPWRVPGERRGAPRARPRGRRG